MVDLISTSQKLGSTLNSLRTYIFVGMVVVLVIPVGLMMRISYQSALQRELTKVEQAHLVIAENLSSTLMRYTSDAIATFNFVASNHVGGVDAASLGRLLSQYEFRFVASFSLDGSVPEVFYERNFDFPSNQTLRALRESAQIDQVSISGVKQVDGQPTIYLSRLIAPETLVVGALDTSYIIDQQSAIAFGERGHAMIVDHEGRVLAHPKPEWIETSKDASGLEVVQRMIAGQTGVMQFYSPPMQADMIAGYTHVPLTGWGVMVPQPVSELRLAAKSEAAHIAQMLLTCFLLAIIASWVISGLITRPIDNLSGFVTRVRDGDLTTRVPTFKPFAPNELTSLSALLNGLLENWSKNRSMLDSSLEAARRANASKTEAVSVLSHEMRTPLNGIVGAVELLEHSNLSKAQVKYLGILSTSANTLLAHVNCVLEVGRLDSSNVVADCSSTNLREVLQDIIKENSVQAQNYCNQVKLKISSSVPTFIKTDPKMLRSIVSNLVGNAVKFTQDGRVEISAKLAGSSSLELRVVDTGTGIPVADIERVFEPFSVLNSSYGRSRGGTGLGLCIVKMSVEALGGTIAVKSEVGTGSEFVAQIPIERVETGLLDLPLGQPDRATATRKAKAIVSAMPDHVLVVDDDEINRIVLSEMLRQLGCEVTTAIDGPDALEIAMAKSFDLILMDISMPEIDGTEVARLLRDHEGPNMKTRIIAQTAHASPSDHDEFEAAGIQGALVKPVSVAALRDVIAKNKSAYPDCSNNFGQDDKRRFIEMGQFDILASAKGNSGAIESFHKLLGEAGKVIDELERYERNSWDSAPLVSGVHNVSGACAMLGAGRLHLHLRNIEVSLKADTRTPIGELLFLARDALTNTRAASASLSE